MIFAIGGMRKLKHAKRRSKRSVVLKIVLITLFVCIAASVVAGLIYVSRIPKVDPSNVYETLDKSSYIYDKNKKKIGSVYYLEDRKITDRKNFPEYLEHSFVAIEDKTFYKHHGVNIKRMFGAVWNSARNGSAISGTSTITQQLARNVFLPEVKSKRTISRKVTEIIYAFEIEKALSKDEIFEAYVNTVYFGYGCYGIDSAARMYFSKKVQDLDLEECAILAALPQAPDTYALIRNEEGDNTVKYRKGVYINKTAEERRDLVLDLMAEQGYISQEQADEAKKPFEEVVKPKKIKTNYDYTYFKSYLLDQIKGDLINKKSMNPEDAESLIYTGGLKIYSTVDPEAQEVIIKEFKNGYNFPNTADYETDPEAAMVITEVGTGRIIAMVGGRESKGENLFNRATSPRQPGSSIKPLAVYAPALQKSYEYEKRGEKYPLCNYKIDSQGTSGWGDYITASSSVRDEKTYINGEQWPNNYTRRFSGSQTFRTALQNSINTCAVKILYQVGFDYSIETLKKFGLTTLVSDTSEPVNDINAASLGLGAMTKGACPLEIAEAYAVFPGGGVRNDPIAYDRVCDSEGNILLEGESQKTEVLDPGVAWIMTDILKSVVSRGIARDASISGVQVGGKTGTTNDTYDIWFAGFVPKYSAALWIGTDENVEMYTTSNTAARLWSRIMSRIPGVRDGEYKESPSNVVKKGGEYYIEGTEPSWLKSRRDENTEKSSVSRDNSIWENDDSDYYDVEVEDDDDDDLEYFVPDE